jgi:urea carboxylase-associated protein 2
MSDRSASLLNAANTKKEIDLPALFEDEIPGGAHWSFIVRRGHVLRLIDKDGGANVGMLLFNPANPLERYNAPDTLKCQHTFKLTRGHCLYSDMGRIFCSIVADSCGWHDTVSGTSNKKLVSERWGERNYQQYRNDRYLNGYDSFLVELAKHGLGRKDMAANINWFSKVAADDEGNLRHFPDHSRAGASVDLRFEMDTLVVLNTCPHPLDTAAEYPKRALIYQLFEAPARAADDACEHACAENERGFRNNAIYLQTQGVRS